MILLYDGGGATLTEVGSPSLPPNEWHKLRTAVKRLLAARNETRAVELLAKYPFELLDGTNYFQDEFSVLHARVPLDQYLELKEMEVSDMNDPSFRRIAETVSEIGPFVRFIAVALDTDETVAQVVPPSPKITSEAVEAALADAEHLIQSRGPAHAVDRVHTALHGYLRAALQRSGVAFAQDASITALFKLLREKSPAFQGQGLGPRSSDIVRVVGALSTIIDALNTLRNQASGAHPASQLLADPEAMLAINAARTLFHYLDEKLVPLD